jgi:hypothetical protein
MECFKNVLAGIAATAMLLVIVGAAVALVFAATVATVLVFTIDPHGAWPLAIMAGYLVVAVGAGIGIADCYE